MEASYGAEGEGEGEGERGKVLLFYLRSECDVKSVRFHGSA